VDGEQDLVPRDHLPVSIRDRLRLSFQKRVRLDPCLLEDRPQRTLRKIAGMIRDGGIEAGCAVEPDLMASRRLSIECEPERL